MKIRTATIEDAPAITSLSATTMREAFGPPLNPMKWVDAYIDEAMTLPRIQQELADPRAVFFVMEAESGELIGYAKVRRKAPPRRMIERNALEIQRIYLLKSHIGGGARQSTNEPLPRLWTTGGIPGRIFGGLGAQRDGYSFLSTTRI